MAGYYLRIWIKSLSLMLFFIYLFICCKSLPECSSQIFQPWLLCCPYCKPHLHAFIWVALRWLGSIWICVLYPDIVPECVQTVLVSARRGNGRLRKTSHKLSHPNPLASAWLERYTVLIQCLINYWLIEERDKDFFKQTEYFVMFSLNFDI